MNEVQVRTTARDKLSTNTNVEMHGRSCGEISFGSDIRSVFVSNSPNKQHYSAQLAVVMTIGTFAILRAATALVITQLGKGRHN